MTTEQPLILGELPSLSKLYVNAAATAARRRVMGFQAATALPHGSHEVRGVRADVANLEAVLEHLDAIDTTIQEVAPEWPIAQMARIDKNVLRLAIYEILFNNTVPAKAAINEAVELAKSYGSETSSRFVNGVLGTIFNRAQQQPIPKAESEV